MPPSTAYLEALDRLCQPIRRGEYVFSLRPMRQLLSALGSPQRQLCAVVVTGSSGKGSTCATIAQLLRANGLNVGLYTSPHLHSFRERFVYNERMITPEEFIAGAEAVRAAAAQVGRQYSTFENATALAYWWFAQQKPDVVVLEIGLGGRWDAVNVVDNALAVFTRIEDEHAAMLGGTLSSVAWHKAGIIQPGGHAVTLKQDLSVYRILYAEAYHKHARLNLTGGPCVPRERHDLSLPLAAWENLLERGIIPRRPFAHPLKLRPLPGRLERIALKSHKLLIDGGHTPEAARYLYSEIVRLSGTTQPVRLIVGLLDDKKIQDYLSVFDSPRFHLVLTRAPSHRGADPEYIWRHSRCSATQRSNCEPNLRQVFDQVENAAGGMGRHWRIAAHGGSRPRTLWPAGPGRAG